jgi:hypothetical protein
MSWEDKIDGDDVDRSFLSLTLSLLLVTDRAFESSGPT